MTAPRVLIVVGAEGTPMRGTLRGFMAAAQERDWTLLHYYPGADLNWVANQWAPAAAVLGPGLDSKAMAQLAPATLISIAVDRSADGIASVCLDEDGIAALALEHLVSRGFRYVSTFRYDESPFAVAREHGFIEHARAAGARVLDGWGSDSYTTAARQENPTAMVAWLRSLPRPTGIFTCTDGWGHTVARYAREAGLRIPEDIAIVGANNDVLECELLSPPLSSVMIPWREVGRSAATLVSRALANQPIAGERIVISPVDVVARRSSDVLAIDDTLVAQAVTWIRENADRRLAVTMVARAVGGGRQRLERRFRRSLDRTVQQEIQRAHVEAAKRVLSTSNCSMAEVAKMTGFTSASLLNAAFQRELGMAPGAYRRQIQKQLDDPDED